MEISLRWYVHVNRLHYRIQPNLTSYSIKREPPIDWSLPQVDHFTVKAPFQGDSLPKSDIHHTTTMFRAIV